MLDGVSERTMSEVFNAAVARGFDVPKPPAINLGEDVKHTAKLSRALCRGYCDYIDSLTGDDCLDDEDCEDCEDCEDSDE